MEIKLKLYLKNPLFNSLIAMKIFINCYYF